MFGCSSGQVLCSPGAHHVTSHRISQRRETALRCANSSAAASNSSLFAAELREAGLELTRCSCEDSRPGTDELSTRDANCRSERTADGGRRLTGSDRRADGIDRSLCAALNPVTAPVHFVQQRVGRVGARDVEQLESARNVSCRLDI